LIHELEIHQRPAGLAALVHVTGAGTQLLTNPW
jgi:hypothetical protein